MMNREEILNKILEIKIMAILRVDRPEWILPTSQAILAGGIGTIEVSLNTPDALSCITEISKVDGILPGVGTVTNAKMAQEAIEAGAEFVVSPISKKEIIDVCHELDKPVFSGALTPGEIFQAHEWGADVIKIFPAHTLGMDYIKAMKAPFPQIKLMPTGGVNAGNIDLWFDMGADFVGIGGCFTKTSILKNEEWNRQTEMAMDLVNNIQHFLETRV